AINRISGGPPIANAARIPRSTTRSASGTSGIAVMTNAPASTTQPPSMRRTRDPPADDATAPLAPPAPFADAAARLPARESGVALPVPFSDAAAPLAITESAFAPLVPFSDPTAPSAARESGFAPPAPLGDAAALFALRPSGFAPPAPLGDAAALFALR